MNLAYFELLGDADLINSEVLNYENITAEQVNAETQKSAAKITMLKFNHPTRKS